MGTNDIDFHTHSASCYRCEAAAWEHVGDFTPHRGKKQDVIECAFCGVRLRVDAAAMPVAAKRQADTSDNFRFQFGRFAGKTLAEADAEPNGRRYLEVMRDSNEKLRPRIEEYLKKNALDRQDACGEIVRPSEQTGATECLASPASSPPLFG